MTINKRIITGILTILFACMPAAEAHILSTSYDYLKSYLFNKETLKIAGTLTIGIILGALITKLKWNAPQSMPQNNPQPAQQPPIKKADTAAQPNPGKQEQPLPTQNQSKQEQSNIGIESLLNLINEKQPVVEKQEPIFLQANSQPSAKQSIELIKLEVAPQGTAAKCAFHAYHNAKLAFQAFEGKHNIADYPRFLDDGILNDSLSAFESEITDRRELIAFKQQIQQTLVAQLKCPFGKKHTPDDKVNEVDLCPTYITYARSIGAGITDIELQKNHKTFDIDAAYIESIFLYQVPNKKLAFKLHTYFPDLEKLQIKVTPEYLKDLVKKSGEQSNEWLSGSEIEHLKQVDLGSEVQKNLTIIDSPLLTDTYMKDQIKILSKIDLHKDFIHVYILGTMDARNHNSRGHWFTLIITKPKDGKPMAYIADSLKHDTHTEIVIEEDVKQLLAEQNLHISGLYNVEEVDGAKDPQVIKIINVFEKLFNQSK